MKIDQKLKRIEKAKDGLEKRKQQLLSRAVSRSTTIRPGRGKTQISISLSTALLKQVDERAGQENRNRSNFIAVVIERALAGDNQPIVTTRDKDEPVAAPMHSEGKWMRHTPDQIEKALKDVRKGLSAKEVCMKHGISMPTLFRWKKIHG